MKCFQVINCLLIVLCILCTVGFCLSRYLNQQYPIMLEQDHYDGIPCTVEVKAINIEDTGFELVIENDPNYWVHIDMDVPPVISIISIITETGAELILSFEGDRLEITGDADMNEAAQVFFQEYIQSIADDYITMRLPKQEQKFDRIEETINAIANCLLAMGEAQLIACRKINEMHAVICYEPKPIGEIPPQLAYPAFSDDPNDFDFTTDILEPIQ